MSAKRHNELMTRIGIHIGCWRQFNHFVNVARAKQFGPEDESHFRELKKIIEQDLEMIFAAIEIQSPPRQEIVALIGRAPSLRHLSEMGEGDLHGIENAWHTIYTGWHSIWGQLKIKRRYGNISFFGPER
jgi:hypothetical protein